MARDTDDQLDLRFDRPDVARRIELLVPLARELAMKAGPHGVTVADVRVTAIQRGLLTGAERGRALSWLSAVMKRAALLPSTEYRRSAIPQSHGNLHRVWRFLPPDPHPARQ